MTGFRLFFLSILNPSNIEPLDVRGACANDLLKKLILLNLKKRKNLNLNANLNKRFARLLPTILGSFLLAHLAAADGDPSLPNPDLLAAEHRQAKEASILDSIASLFGAGETKKPVGPPPGQRPLGPIYRGPQNPPIRRQQQHNEQLQAASIQRPLAVKPPVTFKKPFYPPAVVPPRLQTSETNRNAVVQPGRLIFSVWLRIR